MVCSFAGITIWLRTDTAVFTAVFAKVIRSNCQWRPTGFPSSTGHCVLPGNRF